MSSNYFSVFILQDGTVRTVGYNEYGQCGTGTNNTPQLSLYTIPDLNNVKQIACGNNHIVFLLNDGTVRTVGRNHFGQCGTGNTNTPQLSLYTIPNLNNVEQVACGGNHTVFLLEDGTVRTVGGNEYGQCGTGKTSNTQLSLYTIPNLKVKTLWDLEKEFVKFLIKQYGSYYTINPNYYDLEGDNFIPLELSNGTNPNMNDIINFGFDNITDLINNMTINGNTFKPINKLFSKFEIKKYKY